VCDESRYRSYWGEAFQCSYNATRTPVAARVKNYVVLPSNKYDPVIEVRTCPILSGV
jgi:hypothetical protein